MERDIRQTPLYREIAEHFRRMHEPAFQRVSGAADLAPAPNGRRIAFTGSKLERLEGVPTTRVCIAEVDTGAVEEVTAGPGHDRLPQWSPDGARLAFLSNRREPGRDQLYLLEAGRIGEAVAAPAVEGTIESFAWSPDGRAILLGVAGPGADLAGAQGSGTMGQAEGLPGWLPLVAGGVAEDQWRRAWLYDLASRTSRPLSRPGLNVWEAAWAGADRIVAIVSTAPDEGAWYRASLALIDRVSGQERVIYEGARQLGLPAGSPSGRRLAVVQALCSDRGVVAGDLLLLDRVDGAPRVADTAGVDVTWLAWRDEEHVCFAGLRGLESVYGECDATTGRSTECWATAETSGNRYPQAVPLAAGTFALVLESYERFPEIALVRDGVPRTVAALAHGGSDYLRAVSGTLEAVRWTAPDGLAIEGLLGRPAGAGPHPLGVHLHGGPVWAFRNRWSMGYAYTPLLVSRGYAVLHPNPRGSGGRGQAFAELVYGDMGGGDSADVLAGVDALVGRGVADPARLGIMGGSYGGFLAAWLITQTDRFAAAVPMAPVTDWLSQHYTSNIGAFDRIFLQDEPTNTAGRFFTRNPVLHAARVRTPTLQTAGGRDRCTPPGQAVEFYHALREQGVEAALVLYPEEGHGVRQLPALIDQCARLVAWFERFMPAR